jgi:hypothetical protein
MYTRCFYRKTLLFLNSDVTAIRSLIICFLTPWPDPLDKVSILWQYDVGLLATRKLSHAFSIYSCHQHLIALPIAEYPLSKHSLKNPVEVLNNLFNFCVFSKSRRKAKLMRHCSKIETLQDQQFRFRSDHNILHVMSKVISSTIDICRWSNVNFCVEALLVDLKKAFNTM